MSVIRGVTLPALVSVAALVAPVFQSPGPVELRLERGADPEVRLDGVLDEWPADPHLRLEPEPTPGEVGTPGGLDHRLELWLRADGSKLAFALRRIDDVLDEEVIEAADAVWADADGRRRDRMYLSDGIALRLRSEGRVYTAWLAPRAHEPVQWDHTRTAPGAAAERSGPAAAVTAVARARAGVFELEGAIAWERVGWGPPAAPFSLTVIAPDSDCPGQKLAAKATRCVDYLERTLEIILE